MSIDEVTMHNKVAEFAPIGGCTVNMSAGIATSLLESVAKVDLCRVDCDKLCCAPRHRRGIVAKKYFLLNGIEYVDRIVSINVSKVLHLCG